MHANIDDFQTRNLVKIISKCIRILMILRPQDLPVVVTGLDFRVRAGRDFWYFFESLLKYLGIPWNFLKFPLPLYGDFSSYTVFWAPRTRPLPYAMRNPMAGRDTFAVFWPTEYNRVVYNPMAGRCPEYSIRKKQSIWRRQKFLEKSGEFYKIPGMEQWGKTWGVEWFSPRKSGPP